MDAENHNLSEEKPGEETVMGASAGAGTPELQLMKWKLSVANPRVKNSRMRAHIFVRFSSGVLPVSPSPHQGENPHCASWRKREK